MTTVNAKGQVTIPKALRSKYGFTPGTKILWIAREGGIVLRQLPSLRELRELLRSAPGEPRLAEVLLAERQAELEREDR
jgi:AbrB family looped-hinge helix DNA binding protein